MISHTLQSPDLSLANNRNRYKGIDDTFVQ
jgi:hypothetical protein